MTMWPGLPPVGDIRISLPSTSSYCHSSSGSSKSSSAVVSTGSAQGASLSTADDSRVITMYVCIATVSVHRDSGSDCQTAMLPTTTHNVTHAQDAVTLKDVLKLARQLSAIDQVRLIERVAPKVERDLATRSEGQPVIRCASGMNLIQFGS